MGVVRGGSCLGSARCMRLAASRVLGSILKSTSMSTGINEYANGYREVHRYIFIEWRYDNGD